MSGSERIQLSPIVRKMAQEIVADAAQTGLEMWQLELILRRALAEDRKARNG